MCCRQRFRFFIKSHPVTTEAQVATDACRVSWPTRAELINSSASDVVVYDFGL